MMGVGNINQSKATESAKKKSGVPGASGATGASFASYLAEFSAEAEAPAGVAAASGIVSPDAVFAAQAAGTSDEEQAARQYLCRRAGSLIGKLEEIRDGLLIGAIPASKLIEISRLVQERKVASADPRLQELMAEIELRVEVELAKLVG